MGSGVPKSFKNPGAKAPKSSSGGALGRRGEVLGHLGCVLERPDGLVGCLGGLFARLVGVLLTSWSVLEASCA